MSASSLVGVGVGVLVAAYLPCVLSISPKPVHTTLVGHVTLIHAHCGAGSNRSQRRALRARVAPAAKDIAEPSLDTCDLFERRSRSAVHNVLTNALRVPTSKKTRMSKTPAAALSVDPKPAGGRAAGVWRAAVDGGAQSVAAWLDEGGGVDALYDGATLLMEAAAGGQEAIVRMLLQRGASVNQQDFNGGTALMGATINGRTTIVQVLLDAKANASLQTKGGNTALRIAEQRKHTATAQLLRQHTFNKQLTATAEARAAASVAHAAAAADAMAAELLGEEAAEREEAAAKKGKGKKKKSKAVISTSAAEPAAAVLRGGALEPMEAEEELLETVWSAAMEGDTQIVTAWLDEGGSVDTRCAECDGGTVLLQAASWGGQEAMVRMLLQRGAGIDLKKSIGWTALIAAATGGHTMIVQALLDAKADASLQTENGSTALALAELKQHTATAQLLRQHAKQMTAGAEARAAASIVHAAAAADAMAAKLLGEEAAEKKAAAKKGKGKRKKSKAVISTSAAEPAATALRGGALKPAAADDELPEDVYEAAMDGDTQAVTVWLDEGGGVDTRCAECHGTTLLMAAAYGGREAVVWMLLQRGASINLQNSIGWTALIAAATAPGGHATIVQALLNAKADASLQTENDSTALMLAEDEKRTATTQLLRQHAEQMTAEAEARAVASMVHATAAAEAAGAELLEEVEAEKAAAAKKGKSKKKKAKAAPSTFPAQPDQRVQSAAKADDAVGAVAHLLSQASLQVPAGSSDAGVTAPVAAMASVALDRPPSPPVIVMSLATAHFDTGRPDVPESTIGGQTTCIVCFSNPKSHVAVPCGHQCACSNCSALMKECPVCRTPVATWVHVRVA
eukprot:scaffold28640_cov75-Phaeocystis_antarctica.AAC.6